MPLFRIFYKDKWQNKKSIVIQAESFFEAHQMGTSMFNENFVSYDEIETEPTPDK